MFREGRVGDGDGWENNFGVEGGLKGVNSLLLEHVAGEEEESCEGEDCVERGAVSTGFGR